MTDAPNKIEKVDGRRKNGGRRPGSGRKKGLPNRVTRTLKEAAQEYSEEALGVLVKIMRDKKEAMPSTRAAAASAILDRAHGKPSVTVEGTGAGGAIKVEVITGVPR